MKRKTVLVVDGNNFGWRGFGRAPLFYNGQRTEAIFIGLTMLKKYLQAFCPGECIIAWDGGRDASRTSAYPEYKKKHRMLTDAERAEQDIFFGQLRVLQNVLTRFGFPQYRLRGREADDVIFTLVAEEMAASGTMDDLKDYIIVSTDQDYFQLFDYGSLGNIKVFNPSTEKLNDEKSLTAEMKFPPSYFLYWKAIIGDKSDNLPGVHGLGPAKALPLLARTVEYFEWCGGAAHEPEASAYEGWMKARPELKQADWEKIATQFDTFKLMMDLVEFRYMPDEEMKAGFIPGQDLTVAKFQEEFFAVCAQYGFHSLADKSGGFLPFFEHLIMAKKEK